MIDLTELYSNIFIRNVNDPEVYPIRYSTVMYMDVHAYSDEQHELMCEAIKHAVESFTFVHNVDCGEV